LTIGKPTNSAALLEVATYDIHRGPIRRAALITVCQILHSLRIGGAELMTANLTRSLQTGFRFVFVCLDERGELADVLGREGFRVHALQRRPGVDISCIRRLASLFHTEGVDVIHAHQYTPFFYAAAARCLCRSRPIVFTEHGRTFPDRKRWRRIVANRFMLKSDDRLIAVSSAVKQALIEYEAFPEQRIDVIYNGIGLAAADEGVRRRAALRSKLCLSDEHCAILLVARLDPIKDHATALEAFAITHRKYPHTRLILAGDGTERPGIERRIGQLDLSHAVTMLGTRDDARQLWGAADIGLLSSLSEGFPLVLLEGMAAGVPFAATDVGGVREIVVHEQTGLLAGPNSPAELASQLERLVADQTLRKELGTAARNRIADCFTDDRMQESYAGIYRAGARG